MKITSAKAIPVDLDLVESFSIATETVEVVGNVFFKLETDTGLIGWGCAAPDTVTSETNRTVMKAFDTVLKGVLIGSDPTRIHQLNDIIEDKLKGNQSAKAGVNMGLYDLLGKASNMPLYRLLGGYRDKILTSVTIGISPTDVMVDKAEEWVSKGFKSLKIKCGLNPDSDIDTILAIRAAVGPEIKIRLDANEGYSLEDAIRVVEAIESQGGDIELLEQPTKARYLYALKEVTSQVNVPIMADETALTLRDSYKLIRLEVADLMNIKLMKLGGITNSIKMNVFAEIAEIPVMVGCMNESMGGMVAGVHFACAYKNVQYADLDSALDVVDDPAKGGSRYEDGYVIPPEEPGLGIKVDL